MFVQASFSTGPPTNYDTMLVLLIHRQWKDEIQDWTAEQTVECGRS